jgi:hypothetical protein
MNEEREEGRKDVRDGRQDDKNRKQEGIDKM